MIAFFLTLPAKDFHHVVGKCAAQRCGGFTVTQREKAGEQGPKAAKMHGKLWEPPLPPKIVKTHQGGVDSKDEELDLKSTCADSLGSDRVEQPLLGMLKT